MLLRLIIFLLPVRGVHERESERRKMREDEERFSPGPRQFGVRLRERRSLNYATQDGQTRAASVMSPAQ